MPLGLFRGSQRRVTATTSVGADPPTSPSGMDPAAPSEVILRTLRTKAAQLLIAWQRRPREICGTRYPTSRLCRRLGLWRAGPTAPPVPHRSDKSDNRSLLWMTSQRHRRFDIRAICELAGGNPRRASIPCQQSHATAGSGCNLRHHEFTLEG
jgi:hypothetical protein